jgi:hypothetical protein
LVAFVAAAVCGCGDGEDAAPDEVGVRLGEHAHLDPVEGAVEVTARSPGLVGLPVRGDAAVVKVAVPRKARLVLDRAVEACHVELRARHVPGEVDIHGGAVVHRYGRVHARGQHTHIARIGWRRGIPAAADADTFVCRTWDDLAARLVWAREQGYATAKARRANV